MRKEKMIPVTIWLEFEALEQIQSGHVCRGGIRRDENGQLVYKKYKLGEGKKTGPRRPKPLTSGQGEATAAVAFRMDLTIHLVVDQLGQVTCLGPEPLAALSDDEALGWLAAMFNLENKGGANANN